MLYPSTQLDCKDSIIKFKLLPQSGYIASFIPEAGTTVYSLSTNWDIFENERGPGTVGVNQECPGETWTCGQPGEVLEALTTLWTV